MLKKCWKSSWLSASLVSLAFLLASGSNALQSLKHKASAANSAHHDAGDKIAMIAIDNQQSTVNTVFFLAQQIHSRLAYIHQITNVITQPNIFNLVPE